VQPDDRDRISRQALETPDGSDADASASDAAAPEACAHAICVTGTALVAACDPCTKSLCALDPYCCQAAWDTTCVGEVKSICGQSCSAPPPVAADAGASSCVHSTCATGVALSSTCESCATSLCAQDPYCCTVQWDATCVGEVKSICKKACN
jgi:hypothetical protein